MITQENSSGKPLADAEWLYKHHRAKFPERKAFAEKLIEYNPKTIVDLGCASGLWLEVFDKVVPNDCTFIGIDSDEEILELAKKRSRSWDRTSSFMKLDIESQASLIPPADLTLAFNIFPYIKDLDHFLKVLSNRCPCGALVVRQYDGASIRFGPMPTDKRQSIESSLRVATENSKKFRHYDLDRTYEALNNSSYKYKSYAFELFERTSPFPEDFIPYYRDMLQWTCDHISDSSAQYLSRWLDEDANYCMKRYFFEVDLVAVLS